MFRAIDDLNGDGNEDANDISHLKIRTVVTAEGTDLIVSPWGDSYNSTETSLITNKTPHSSGNIWLASRRLDSTSSQTSIYVRYLSSNGSVGGSRMYGGFYEDTWTNGFGSCGVRPIITLKTNLKVVSGADCDGSTKAKAYVLQTK